MSPLQSFYNGCTRFGCENKRQALAWAQNINNRRALATASTIVGGIAAGRPVGTSDRGTRAPQAAHRGASTRLVSHAQAGQAVLEVARPEARIVRSEPER